MGKSWKIKPGARQDQPTVNRGWQLWNFDPGWGTGGPTGQRVNGSRVLTLALWPCLWIRYLNKPLTRALEAWVFGLGPRSVRSRSSSTLISGPSLGRWRVCSDRDALLSWAPAHPCPPPLSGLSLPALPLRAAPSAPWPLPSLVARPWQVGQPRPTRETVNPCRREGSRAAGQHQSHGRAPRNGGKCSRGRWGLPATGSRLEFIRGAAMVRSLPLVSGQFEFDLGKSQEGGKTRQTGGRCLILRLRAQVGGLPCRLPSAALPCLPTYSTCPPLGLPLSCTSSCHLSCSSSPVPPSSKDRVRTRTRPRTRPSTSTAPCPPAEKAQRTRDGRCARGRCRM